MLTPPGADRSVLTPTKVTAYASCLKWQIPEYAKVLSETSGGKTDYLKRPAEDFARSLIEYKDDKGQIVVVETTTSWCYVGAGLRLSMELLGPEYSLQINTLDANLKVFFSRKVKGKAGEDLVEKQNAEVGLMPVVSDEEKNTATRLRTGTWCGHSSTASARWRIWRTARRDRAPDGRLHERREREDPSLPASGTGEFCSRGGAGDLEPEEEIKERA